MDVKGPVYFIGSRKAKSRFREKVIPIPGSQWACLLDRLIQECDKRPLRYAAADGQSYLTNTGIVRYALQFAFLDQDHSRQCIFLAPVAPHFGQLLRDVVDAGDVEGVDASLVSEMLELCDSGRWVSIRGDADRLRACLTVIDGRRQ